MSKYDDYVEMCENEGETPLLHDEWMAMRRAEGREAGKARREALATVAADSIYEDPTPAPVNPPEGTPEDSGKILVDAAAIDRLLEKVDELEARIAVATTPRDPSTLPEPIKLTPPEPWGANGSYSYMSDVLELQLTIEPGHTKMVNNRMITVPDKGIAFNGGRYTTTDPEIRDWLEAQPEFNGTGGAKYPARVWRTELLHPGHHVVQVTDGARTSRTTQQARYADRPSPLHAKV